MFEEFTRYAIKTQSDINTVLRRFPPTISFKIFLEYSDLLRLGAKYICVNSDGDSNLWGDSKYETTVQLPSTKVTMANLLKLNK